MTIILASIWLALIPTAFWAYVYLRMGPEPRKLAMLTFLGGMISVLPVFALDYLFDVDAWLLGVVESTWWIVCLSSLYVGLTEEYMKHFVVKEIDYRRKEFKRVIDGIEFSVIAALGFAFVENVRFFVLGSEEYGILSMSFVLLFIFRSLISTLAHTVFSGLYGYYFGKAKLVSVLREGDKKKTKLRLKKAFKLRIRRLMHYFNIKRYSEDVVMYVSEGALAAEGLLIAMFLHGLFNLTLAYELAFLIIPFLAVEFWIVIHELAVPQNREVFWYVNNNSVQNKK